MRRVCLLFALAACGRLEFERHEATVDATDVTPALCGSTVVFDDPFDDTTPAPLFGSYANAGMTTNEAGGAVSFVFGANVGAGRYSGYFTPIDYPAQEFCATVEVGELPVDEGLAYFDVVGATQEIEFITYLGIFEMRTVTNDVPTTFNMLPVDPATQKFWRLRQHAGVTYWDVSADNTTFVNVASTTFLTETMAAPGIGAGGVQTTTNGGQFTVQQMTLTQP